MKKIFITQPFLPPISDYKKLLEDIWDSKVLTNNGYFHQKFEKELSSYLNVKYISIVNNATTGLILAQKAMEFKGEIITTPYSFIATAHSILWNGLKPVFLDVDDCYGNLKVSKIIDTISPTTGGILAAHNYGIPCDLKSLKIISSKYNIPLIIDAAPGMGVKLDDKSIFNYGITSVVSFHGTKVFTTMEGGAVICPTLEIKEKIDKLKNFSILNQNQISGLGINGKMNEAEAALGILQLKYLESNIKKRKIIFEKYKSLVAKSNRIRLLDIPKNISYNYCYAPIFFLEGRKTRDLAFKKMKEHNIICRKYWSPLITDHNPYSKMKLYELKNAKKLSDRVLCLPIYPDIEKADLDRILKIILQFVA
ncbi:MAG: aminotransferase [Candidatus Marinimicrobia bacterium]|nr:aminotransferase [Candidatus Neomarinimicrobiota bacterium]